MREAQTRNHDPARSSEVRRGISRSSADPARLVESIVGWLRNAVAWDGATVNVLLPDAAGRLQTFVTHGVPVTTGRLRSRRRRQVFQSGRPLVVTLQRPAGHALALYPLMVGQRSVGVAEIIAPADTLEDRKQAIGSVVAQSAIVLRSAIDKRKSDLALRDMGGMVLLAGDLLRADTISSAIKRAALACFRRAGMPIAALLPDPSGTGWSVIATHGLSGVKRVELRRRLDDPGVRGGGANTGERLASRFATIAGCRRAEAFDAGEALLIVGDLRTDDEAFVRTAAAFLGEALDRIGAVHWAQTRNENLDLAIACTAHELKAPLVGARAALDRVTVADHDPDGQRFLQRSREELGMLADLVDPLLRWSAGSSSLAMDRTDLVRVVRDTVRSCGTEPGGAEVSVHAPEHVWVLADGQQLGQAIANVVRNAVSHAPEGTPVRVVVEEAEDIARVRVRDRGPGVPASERGLIFDPFARGTSAGGRGGRGLGLFIARRILEAHEGAIGVRSVRPGTEFWIELPSIQGRRSASSS